MGKRRIPVVGGAQPGHADRLRYATPEETLDLHGLEVAPALAKVTFFLERTARLHGGRAVQVITGRGMRSSDGPRMRDAVEHLLRGSPWVSEFERATDGGSVFVRLPGRRRQG